MAVQVCNVAVFLCGSHALTLWQYKLPVRLHEGTNSQEALTGKLCQHNVHKMRPAFLVHMHRKTLHITGSSIHSWFVVNKTDDECAYSPSLNHV